MRKAAIDALAFCSERLARVVFAFACVAILRLLAEGPPPTAHADRVIVYLNPR